ncbi:phenylacetate-CoA ligase [Arthrobacter sp. V1I9]|uniref:hypothetical protein n=1 Tax=Arthrobacter sp. V1I9 TaxID=3042275 RepID=UPI0027939B56|nr:hypothetical protein [Arthrobacter sp. V1I9]MDQ0868264.1 phenylacetate-CoA ligase [Arthrobacter sp. V1I9]
MLSSIREKLAHSSPAIRESVGRVSYWLPTRVRLGANFYVTLEEIDRARRDGEWARERQRHLLESVVAKALSTPYYSERAAYADRSEDIYERLSQFPVLTRAEMTQNRDVMLTVPKSKADLVSTSGSSGKPAVFYLDKVRGASEWAYVCDTWSRSGYHPDAWRAVLRGQRLGPKGKRLFVSRSTRELYLSPFGLDTPAVENYWNEISKRQIEFLHGYPSSLAAVAKAALRHDPLNHRARITGVFPVSEPLTPAQSELLRLAFPSAVALPFYGLSERVAFAEFNVESENYTFAPLYGHVEVVDEVGKPVQIGQVGRIIATGLRLTAMPLLRYDTGDMARLEAVTTFGTPVVSSLRGKRTQEHLYTDSGAPISTSALNVHSQAYSPILAFRFVQKTFGKVEVLIVLTPEGTSDDASLFAAELQRNCGDRIKFDCQVLPSLPDTVNGKQKLVEIHIPEVAEAT